MLSPSIAPHNRSFLRLSRQCVYIKPLCILPRHRRHILYAEVVPKLWNKTIDLHRRAVHDAVVDTAAELVAKNGLLAVTMSEIAGKTGIGRATLYKYFPSVEAILLAWHRRQITRHLEYLAKVGGRTEGGAERIEAVLKAYAHILHDRQRHHDSELAALLHRDRHVARAQDQVFGMIRDLLISGAKAGHIRRDIGPDELARYCLHALSAASGLSSKAAVHRLVSLISAGLRADQRAATGRSGRKQPVLRICRLPIL